MIRSALLAAAGLGHAHSTRADGPVGPLRLPGAAANRAALVRAAGGDAAALAVPEQVHGARVARAERGGTFAATDGLVTAARGVPLLVQGADCPLVLILDPRARVVAALHSGWRGTAARIAAVAVDAAIAAGASRDDLVAAVFPGIGPCCYEVGEDVRAAFVESFGADADVFFERGRPGHWLADVRTAILGTLLECGVGEVDVVPGCTACGGRLYSHRASGGAPERHGLVAVL